ncbi:MFS transporter, ACS family, allantoate permease [Purpureocillium lilacinum]|uniref:MFS transporter, ACS family, allantoate permease n=1 Tax=Purpureocillium lilacinum TaxID=33203 RepID=A0A179GJG3_PURLI|nr:MFS transporter, ACS family, allantoate permease [Purpureocillium lilacinum]OAQ77997.1 MFS transporter, ACS family, allantoate permease [Purpureocillium lilacinum]
MSTSAPTQHDRHEDDEIHVPEKVHNTSNVDIGAQIVAGTVIEFDQVVMRRALWKIDLWVLPLLALTTMLQFLDKSTLSYAAIFGIIEDTGLEGTDYSWLASIFYFGYLLMQPIAAHILQKLQPAKCLAASVFFWGVILFMHTVCDNWGKLMAVRFFLGMTEGVVTPAFMLISSAWYARQDQPLRMGIWFSFNGVALILGGILAYGLGHIQVGIASWKWMFLVTGALSVLWAVLLWFMLPDHQGTAWFLTDAEKRAAVEMVRHNHTGIHNNNFRSGQLWEALTDVKTWAFFLMATIWNVPNSIATFGNLVIKNFDYGVLETTLLGMPSGALEFIVMIAITYACLRLSNTRTWCMTVALTIALVGSIMVFAAPYSNKAALLCGYYLVYAFPTGYILLLAMASANVAGHTKKVVTNSLLLIGYSAGNIIGPQFFKTNQQPRYLCLRFYLVWQNKSRASARQALEEISTEEELAQYGFRNLTDKENPMFVYVY